MWQVLVLGDMFAIKSDCWNYAVQISLLFNLFTYCLIEIKFLFQDTQTMSKDAFFFLPFFIAHSEAIM